MDKKSADIKRYIDIHLELVASVQKEDDDFRQYTCCLSLGYKLDGQIEKAVELCDELIKLRPDDVICIFYKAYPLGTINRFDEAIELWDSLIKRKEGVNVAFVTKKRDELRE